MVMSALRHLLAPYARCMSDTHYRNHAQLAVITLDDKKSGAGRSCCLRSLLAMNAHRYNRYPPPSLNVTSSSRTPYACPDKSILLDTSAEKPANIATRLMSTAMTVVSANPCALSKPT